MEPVVFTVCTNKLYTTPLLNRIQTPPMFYVLDLAQKSINPLYGDKYKLLFAKIVFIYYNKFKWITKNEKNEKIKKEWGFMKKE